MTGQEIMYFAECGDDMNRQQTKSEIEALEKYEDDFRAKHLREFARLLDHEVRVSKRVSHMSDLERASDRLGRYAISRQRLSQIIGSLTSHRKEKNPSMISPATCIGIAHTLGLPYEKFLEAAGYRTDFGQSVRGAASQMVQLFQKMTAAQQNLTLEIAQTIVSTLTDDSTSVQKSPDEEMVLEWWKHADDPVKTMFRKMIESTLAEKAEASLTARGHAQLAAGSADKPPETHASDAPASPKSSDSGQGEILNPAQLTRVLNRLPDDRRQAVLRLLEEQEELETHATGTAGSGGSKKGAVRSTKRTQVE